MQVMAGQREELTPSSVKYDTTLIMAISTWPPGAQCVLAQEHVLSMYYLTLKEH